MPSYNELLHANRSERSDSQLGFHRRRRRSWVVPLLWNGSKFTGPDASCTRSHHQRATKGGLGHVQYHKMSQLPTPGGSRLPKVSGLPTPGRSGIPAPGRARSTTNGTSTPHTVASTPAALSRAFDEAIQANDPRRKGRISEVSGSSLSPPNTTRASPSEGGRKSYGGSIAGSSRAPSARSPSVASAVSTTSSTGHTPRTPNSVSYQTKISSTVPPPPQPFSPPYSARSSSARPESRTSNVGARSLSSAKVRSLEIGDAVRIESLAVEGILRYLGGIEGKPGTYAGVELSGAFAGRGKNDGSVTG